MIKNNLIRGFTVVELMVSIGILGILFALTTINLGRLPASTSQNVTIDTIISDIKSQQTKAMAGGGISGIHFGTTSYTLTPENLEITLDPGLSFTGVTFPDNDLNFASGNGETTAGSFTLENSQIDQNKTVNINKYGATQ